VHGIPVCFIHIYIRMHTYLLNQLPPPPPLVLSASWMIFASESFFLFFYFFWHCWYTAYTCFHTHIYMYTYLFNHRGPSLGPIRVLDEVGITVVLVFLNAIRFFLFCIPLECSLQVFHTHIRIHMHTCLIIVDPPLVLSASWMMFASQLFLRWLGPPFVSRIRFQSSHPTDQNFKSWGGSIREGLEVAFLPPRHLHVYICIYIYIYIYIYNI